MANILSTAQSGLLAAQAGLATTGHNIANQKTPGYSRQLVIQSAISGQYEFGGFIGKGTSVVAVRRQYSDYLGAQLQNINTAKGQIDSHFTEISRINNLLADQSSGLAPVLQDFFKSVQALSGGSSEVPSRGGMLAAAESLAGRFQSLNGQMQEMREQVNTQISTVVGTINSYAQQIAALNDAISKAQTGADNQAPNDLLDQRDYLVGELSKETQVSVIKEGLNYTVFIGNGQPMVIGSTASKLAVVPSPTDPRQLQVGYVAGSGTTVPLAENGLPGGKLGGLFEFRSKTLDSAQNALGRIALGLAATFNAQHKLGQDQNGAMGGNFFSEAIPVVHSNSFNKGVPAGTPAVLDASIADVGKLTGSDYTFARDGVGNYVITRVADNVQVYSNAAPPAAPIDGVNFTISSGTMASGDNYLVRPTINGAASFNVLVKDQALIAAAVPIVTAYDTTNAGTGAISEGTIDGNFLPAMAATPISLAFDAATGEFNDAATGPGTGFAFPVKVTVNGTSTIYAAGTPVPYSAGATITFGASLPGPPPDVGGMSIKITGVPKDGDKFTVSANPKSDSDNRNMLLLGALQTANTLVNGTTTYQGAFGQLVSQIGNKTHELEVTQSAEEKLLEQVTQSQQAVSGVNLDEEATNLIRYQQAYQASAKVMQAVQEMFDILASLGR
ncbi:flagellar hook-associated protein FlgK [Noviherbaspirillum cavernae]|uniref:Flagellar hook-associated protein 1 n=1 Tax=Noviherbaspirillum cavernae TaxID=2320862 RepID=A0A418X0R0_9BURK|nr:flagellar hook-associated protein FlgK [Noviherbaspirillum cavernae]RJG05943.1 flagellar hook-associated protein FlgK [Noviherbaspirillum cavernae]